MNSDIALAPIGAVVRKSASRPGLVERIMCVAMMFFLAYSTPDRWFIAADLTGGDGVVPPDPFAVLATLGFAAYFAHKLAGNWRPIFWVALQDRLFVAFFVVLGLSALWSAEPSATVQDTVVLMIVIFYGLYLVVRFSIREVLGMASWALGIGMIVDFVWIFALPQFGDSAAGWKGVHPTKNGLGRIHVLSAIVFLLGARTFRRFRVVNYLLAALGISLVVGSTSTTSLVSLLLALGTTAVAQVFRARKTLFGAVVLSTLASAVAAVGFATANLGPITDLLGKDVTFTGRTPLWDFAMGETLSRPLTGYGWSGFWNGFHSPAHETWIEFAWLPPHAHNAFIDYALQLGWPAVALFSVMLLRVGYRCVEYVRDTSGPTGLFPLAMVIFSFLFSLSEAGVVVRNIFFLLLTFSLYTAAVSRVSKEPERVSGRRQLAQP